MKTRTLFLAWQDPETRAWFPVGKLSSQDGIYRFVYTQGAKASPNFTPFGLMRDLKVTYTSKVLFPLFANRLISSKRPEYSQLLMWLDIHKNDTDPLLLLARTEGIRETDALSVFACPTPDEMGRYHVQFLSHGLRYLPDDSLARISKLHSGDSLFVLLDPQNPHDRLAIALRTDDPKTIVGYCPRYMVSDIHEVLANNLESVQVRVKRVNLDAPIRLRLLCELTAQWPPNFQPCSGENYKELASHVTQSTLFID